MKVAFAVWNGRIAPVFDAAQRLHIIEMRAGKIVKDESAVMTEDLPFSRAARLADLGVVELVCGAVSRSLQELVTAYGIKVLSFIAGDLQEVINAWLAGTLRESRFVMPGCCQGRCRMRRRRERCVGSAEINSDNRRRRRNARRR